LDEFSGQLFFEFKDWKECFQSWKDNIKIYDDMQMVISTHSLTSGYWIEKKGTHLTQGDIAYTGSQVDELEKRIIEEIEISAIQNRCAKFTT
jgi:hypothetical protein